MLAAALMLAGCSVNALPTYEGRAAAAWAQVENRYQRRADLVPNLVETVKGFAPHKRDAPTAVVEIDI